MKTITMITSVHKHSDVRIYHKEGKHLINNNFKVNIISPSFSGRDKNGIRFIKMQLPKNRILRIISSNPVAYKKAIRVESDIYHIHDPELLPMAVALSKKGHRVVYDAHEDLPKQILSKQWIPSILRSPIGKLSENYLDYATQKLSAVVTATPIIKENFKKAIVLANYPVISECSKGKDYFTRGNNLCYVGGISANRGITQMIKSTIATDTHLLLAGSIWDKQSQIEINKGLKSNNISYYGYLSRNETYKLLNKSKIGLLLLQPTTAYKESIPIKLFEYMLAGLPVIASDFTCWRELIGDRCCIYVNPNNTKEIVKSINYLLNNPKEAKLMGEAGRQQVMRRFNFATEGDRLIRLYQTIGGDRN